MKQEVLIPTRYRPRLAAIEFSIPKKAYASLPSRIKDYFPRNHFTVGYLISTSTAKAEKARELGWQNAVLYLTPSTKLGLPKVNLCGAESEHCKTACLDDSGRLGIASGQKAMAARTLYLLFHQRPFLDRVLQEVEAIQRFSDRYGLRLSLRLNGTSDRPWEAKRYGRLIQKTMAAFPDVALYDYTKHFTRATGRYRDYHGISRYHVTFSYSGSNWKQCRRLLSCGTNVSVPFRDDLPPSFRGASVIDGDKHDLRFLDPEPRVVGLRFKTVRDGNGNTVRPGDVRHFVKAA